MVVRAIAKAGILIFFLILTFVAVACLNALVPDNTWLRPIRGFTMPLLWLGSSWWMFRTSEGILFRKQLDEQPPDQSNY
jgi:hypothetical protein